MLESAEAQLDWLDSDQAGPASMPSTLANRAAGCEEPETAFPSMGWTLSLPWPVWLPLIVLFGMSALVVALNLDLAVAGRFWSEPAGWSLSHAGWAKWVYRWNNLPALVVGGTALLLGLASWRTRRKLAVAFLLLALVHGGTTSFVRMGQGAHWFSDVLWSAGIVYFTALVLHSARLGLSATGAGKSARPSSDRESRPISAGRDRPVRISIVVPFYNEAGNVAPVLGELLGVLPAAEVIAVDDGSSDTTWEEILSVRGVRGLRLGRNLGQSAAMYHGLHAATGELCGVMDGDGQNDPANFLILLQEWTQGEADVVCGYRERRADAWHRRVASRVANRVRRWILDDGVRDTGCSQKLFPRTAVDVLVPFRGMHRYLPALFKHAGLRITEVPVLHRERRSGISKYDNWRRALAGMHDLVGVSWLLKRKFSVAAPLAKS